MRDGKIFVFDLLGNCYKRFNRHSIPSKTEVIVSKDQIVKPKKKKKKRRFFGR